MIDHAIEKARAEWFDQLKGKFDATTLLQVQVLLTSIDLWDADQLGYTDPASWQVTEDTLTKMGLLTAPIDLGAAYTNDFVPTQPQPTPEATAAL